MKQKANFNGSGMANANWGRRDIIRAAGIGAASGLVAGCAAQKHSGPVVREPEVPGDATIEYTSPGDPPITADMVSTYLPMIKEMLTPRIEKVTDFVYSAQGYALGNIIMIVTDDGLVIIDTSDNEEVSARIMKEFRKITAKPLRYLIYTHHHIDHIGGTHSVYEEGAEIIATEEFPYWLDYQGNFLGEHQTRARNNQGGNAAPEFGFSFPLGLKSPAKVSNTTDVDVVMPTITFKEKYEFSLGGRRFELYHTPGESEDMLSVWMPDEKILFCGDIYYKSFPNLSTPMLESRPVRGWIKSLELYLELEPEIMVPQHWESIIGKDLVREHLTNYRDAVKHVHHEAVRCINEGKPVHEAVAEIKLPPRLAELPYLRERYGKVEWSVRGIYHGYKGWYNGYGTGLYPLPPSHLARELVEMAGGPNTILVRAIDLQKNGEYQLAMEMCDVVLNANPHDSLAHRIKADCAHQLAYSRTNLNTTGFMRSAYSIHMKAAHEGGSD